MTLSNRTRTALAVALFAVVQSLPAQVVRRFGLATPMRDGAKLVSDAWIPSDSGRCPVILIRTPYGRVADATSNFPGRAGYFAKNGYTFVVQDVRGRGDSDGEFDFFFQEANDGYDTIEWLAAQPWSSLIRAAA